MPGFDDLRQKYLEYLDPNALAEDQGDDVGTAPLQSSAPTQAKQAAIGAITPETQGYGSRLLYGAMGDLKDLGQNLFSLGSAAANEGARLVGDPSGRLASYEDTLSHPMESGEALLSSMAQGFVEPYREQPGEGPVDVIKRNLLDHPLRVGMDLAAVVGGPAELAAKAGLPGAAAVAEAVSAADPINLAKKALYGVGTAVNAGAEAMGLTTPVPGAIERLHAQSIISDQASDAATRAQYNFAQFTKQRDAVFAGLDDTEKTMFFPYTEGRLKAMSPESGMAGGVAELSPATGQWTPNSLDPARLARLEAARQAYMPLLADFETKMGYDPETSAVQAGLSKQRELVAAGADPLHPDSIAQITQAANEAGANATEGQTLRRTVSTRTALDQAKLAKFQEEVQRIQLEQGADAAQNFAKQYPPEPTTPEEALSVMGPQGALYVPHSGEVLTKGLSTVGNILTKVRESVPWKTNTGALIRSGALEQLDPEKALTRTYVALAGGKGFAEIADAVGRQMGEVLEPGYKFGTDPDFRAGTHQLLKPGIFHQEGAATEQLGDLMAKLLPNATDPEVAALDAHDLASGITGQMDTNFPLRSDAPVYKIPVAAGDALKAFKASFDPPTNPFTKFLDAAADPFHYVTLNLRPARILNMTIGHTIFQTMEGIHPFSTTGIGAISDMAQAVAGRLGLSTAERSQQLAKVFDLPGVANTFERDVGATGTGAFVANNLGLPGRLINGYAQRMLDFSQQVSAGGRALSTLFELRKADPEQWANTLSLAKHTIDTGTLVEHLAGQGVNALDDAGYQQVLGNVNKYLNDYNRSSPIERTMWRRIFPYEKFYRHALNLALSAPFDDPIKTTLLRGIGGQVQQEMRERLQGYGFDPATTVPPAMQNSIPIAMHDDPERGRQVTMLNLKGQNPFSILSAEDPGDAGLGAVHPALKTIVEDLTGVNLFNRQKFTSSDTTESGKHIDAAGNLTDETVRPGPISLFSRQFFPVQMMRDIVANGRQPLDDASLLQMVMASASGHEGDAYRVNARGVAERRPYSPLTTLGKFVGPVPQTLEMPTQAQAQAQSSEVSDAFNKIARAHPELQERLLDLLGQKLDQVQPRQLPYRPE